MAILCLAFERVLIEMVPNPIYSKALFRVIDSVKFYLFKLASIPISCPIPKKTESKISFVAVKSNYYTWGFVILS